MSTEWMPGAIKRELPRGVNHTSSPRTRKDGGIFHTAASDGTGQNHYDYWRRNPGVRVSSHFYVDLDGTITQLVRLSWRSWTSVNGSYRTWGLESQGWPYQVWTKKQVESLAAIVRWTSQVEGTPIRQMVTTSSAQRGIGHHSTPYGGEMWNPNRHKCPGALRVAQIPEILRLAGGSGSLSVPSNPGGLVTRWNQSGFNSAYVRRVQTLLFARGYNIGTSGVDGSLGPDTYGAVRRFQAAVGITVDGSPGPDTMGHLMRPFKIKVDQDFGFKSTVLLQLILGTEPDGILSGQPKTTRPYQPRIYSAQYVDRLAGGSSAVHALQGRLGVGRDGSLGPGSISSWQRKLGVDPDKYFGPKTAGATQRALNRGRLW